MSGTRLAFPKPGNSRMIDVAGRTRFCGIYLLVFLRYLQTCSAACFFPTELQGEFVMQSIFTGEYEVQYSRVNVTAESVPVWGLCHRRTGNNFILMDSFSGANCIRCFQLTLKSRNVLLVRTEGLDKCYTTEEAAEATCPHSNRPPHRFNEILLYKTKDLGGEEISKTFCPVHGRFTFLYNVDDGTEDKMECDTPVSEMDSCVNPSLASSLNLRFRRCSFSYHDITFHCLGDWDGPGDQRYLALLDHMVGNKNRPQYRCALYHTDKTTGNVYIAFSSDSTCTTNLRNSTSGYETLILTPAPEPAWPPKVLSAASRFPSWMQGNWEHMSIDERLISYKDHLSYRMLQIRPIGSQSSLTKRFPVFIRDQCGGEAYNCIWVEKRAANVLEFQLGLYPSAVYNDSLCIESNFQDKVWITQGRLEVVEESPCPITGEYTGLIPDAMGLCAKLSSDCKSKEIMYYTMSECVQKDIYEERDYRCLGQWKENGLMYTYTQRRDIGTYECFVGSIISTSEIYIKEAGEHCERDVDPLHLGMKLSRKGECTDSYPSPIPWDVSSRQTTLPYGPTVQWRSTHRPYVTKPWKPITAPPRIKNEVLNSGVMKGFPTSSLPALVLMQFIIVMCLL